MVRWQIEDRRLDRAVEYAERARARALVDRLLAARVDLRRHIPAERLRPLEEREAVAKRTLAEVQKRILFSEVNFASEPSPSAALDEPYRRLADADREYLEVEEEILGASRLWRELAGRSPVSLDFIQRHLAPPQGALLLYEIGPESSYLFVLPHEPAPAAVYPLVVDAAGAQVLGVSPGVLSRDKVQRILGGSEAGPGGVVGLLQERPRGDVAGGARPRGPAACALAHRHPRAGVEGRPAIPRGRDRA